jgi:hypothetical protein
MKRTLNAVLAVASLAAGLGLAGAALAHGQGKPEHGGVLQLVGETSVELVNRPDHVEVWVEDEGEEIASAGLTGKLLVESPAKSEIALSPAGENKLEAKGATLAKGSEVTVLLTATATQAKTAATFKID